MKITTETTHEELLEIAKATLKEVDSGEVFAVRDLFRGFEWERVPMGTRIKLGSAFFLFAQSDEGVQLVEIAEKTKQNQQQDRKR